MGRLRVQHCIIHAVTRQYGPHPTFDLLGVDYFRTVPPDTEFPKDLGRLELFVRIFAFRIVRCRLRITVSLVSPTGGRPRVVYRWANRLDNLGLTERVCVDRSYKLRNIRLPGEGIYCVRVIGPGWRGWLPGLKSRPIPGPSGPVHRPTRNNRPLTLAAEAAISTAFLFPGQGAQTVGMARDLAAASPVAKALFDQAADALGYDLLDVCTIGPADRLNATDVSQPAIYVASLAALEQLKATDPAALDGVAAAAGLSLGEYTALTFAGSLSFADGLKVVQARGRAMQDAAEAIPGAMASLLGANPPDAEAIVAEARGGGTLEVANLLCPGNTVISGSMAAVDAACTLAEEKGFKPIRLAVAGAFHTDLMKPADDHLAAALAGVTLAPPRLPVWSNVDAKPHTDPDEIQALLVRQVVSPVRWEETMRGMLAAGVTGFCEIGPGRVLAGLLKRVDRKLPVRNVTA